jgi:competence protein ComEA
VHSFTLTRRQTLVLVAVALVLVFAAAHLLGRQAGGTSVDSAIVDGATESVPALTTPAGTDAAAAPASASSPSLVVDVAGAVRRPGVYRLSQGARITDAITRAGGLAKGADSSLVDLAAPLADGEQVLVPSTAGASGGGAAAAGGAGSAPSAPVDLNTATAEQLDALPGIGPVTAQKIVDYRQQHGPFRSVDDLDAIPGIGPARIANLEGLVIA